MIARFLARPIAWLSLGLLAAVVLNGCNDNQPSRTEGDRSDAGVDSSQDSGTDGGVDGSDTPDVTGVQSPECPGDYEECVNLTCQPSELCLAVQLTCGPAAGQTAQCIPHPCPGEELDPPFEEGDCGSAICDAVNDFLGVPDLFRVSNLLYGGPGVRCVGGSICASPETMIATPWGDRPMATLEVGDLVLSPLGDDIGLVPLLAVTRRPAPENHHVVALTLDDGTVLHISGPHPTAEGRRLDGYVVGDELDGRRVVATELIPYTHAHTYDILPASETGAYLAQGVWMGSTLTGAR